MNQFIAGQCRNMIQSITLFKQSCEFAAKRDDGQISKDERKTISKINSAADAFTKELEKLIKE